LLDSGYVDRNKPVGELASRRATLVAQIGWTEVKDWMLLGYG
jgi:hypothetical protein